MKTQAQHDRRARLDRRRRRKGTGPKQSPPAPYVSPKRRNIERFKAWASRMGKILKTVALPRGWRRRHVHRAGR